MTWLRLVLGLGKKQGRPFVVAVTVVFLLVAIAPLIAFSISSLRGGVGPEAWAELRRQTFRTGLLLNSLSLAGLTAFACTLIGVPLGYLLSRTDVPARKLLTTLCAAPLFLPPFVWAVAWQAGLRDCGLSGLGGALLVMTLSLFPIVALLSGVGFAHVDPSLEEDARTLAGEAKVFRHATLPLARSLILAGVLIVLILTLGEFGVPALMQVNVYPVAIFTAFSALYDFGLAAVLCLPLVVIALVVAWGMQRALRGVDSASLTEQWAPRKVRLGQTGGVVAACSTGLLLGAVLVVPIGALARAAGDPNGWSDAREPLILGLLLSAAGATLVSFLGLAFAWLCHREHFRGGRWWIRGQAALFAVPSAVVGLGLVCLWNHASTAWLYGSLTMILLGFAARYVPLFVWAFDAFLAQVPKECEEAMAVDGAGLATIHWRFVVPVSRRALGLLWAVGFVLCMGELAVTILVSPPGAQTLAVRLFTIEANAPQSRTASLALVLVASCLVPLMVLASIGALTSRRKS